MKCFFCGSEVEGNEYTCHHCGADILLYRQLLYTSDVYYNKGLDEARVRDISGAIEALRTSLSYYKYNTKARNLLGLCYYEIGEVVKAINEWVISRNLDENNPDAERYLAEIENNPDILTKLNSTIRKYNQAIEYCKAGSRDLAMIQLKKVISQNKNLISARQLLALLYMQDGKFTDARKEMIEANKIDTNNTITLRYLRETKEALKANTSEKRRKKNDIVSFNDGNDTIMMPENSFRAMMDGSRSSLGNILMGLVIGLLICFFLVVPEVKDRESANQTEAMLTLNESYASLQAEVKRLTSENDSLKGTVDSYENKPDIQTSYEWLIASEVMYNEGDTTSAMNDLFNVNQDVLGEAGKAHYAYMNGLLKPAMLQEYYAIGHTFYSEGNYESAMSNLQMVVDMDITYENGAALFLLADCQRLTGKNDEAVKNYGRVVHLYPNGNLGAQAKTYILAEGLDPETLAAQVAEEDTAAAAAQEADQQAASEQEESQGDE